jgi:hypothetical protein
VTSPPDLPARPPDPSVRTFSTSSRRGFGHGAAGLRPWRRPGRADERAAGHGETPGTPHREPPGAFAIRTDGHASGGQDLRPCTRNRPPAAGAPPLDPGRSGMAGPAGTCRAPKATRPRPPAPGRSDVGCSTWRGRTRPGRAKLARRDATNGFRLPFALQLPSCLDTGTSFTT